MKQDSFAFSHKPKATRKTSALADFDERNLESAREILATPAKYGGIDAYPVRWARDVLERLGETA